MLVMEKYSSEEGLGIRKIRDKRNKRRMNILGTEVYRRGNVRNEKSTMQGKYWEILNRGIDMIG